MAFGIGHVYIKARNAAPGFLDILRAAVNGPRLESQFPQQRGKISDPAADIPGRSQVQLCFPDAKHLPEQREARLIQGAIMRKIKGPFTRH